MGYTTEFQGRFDVTPQLTPEHAAYLTAFSRTRRMRRDETITATLPDPAREAVGLPVGPEGAFYVGGAGQNFGEDEAGILDYNTAPGQRSYWDRGNSDGQPGLWCQWAPTEDLAGIEWDGGEKFYEYTDWMRYLLRNFLGPWGYAVSGRIEWQGEDREDVGVLIVEGDTVRTLPGAVTYAE